MTDMTNDKWINIDEAAKYLWVKPATIRDWIRKGKGGIPAQKIGKQWGSYRIEYLLDLFRPVNAEDLEAETFQLLLPSDLQGTHGFAGAFQFHKPSTASGEENDTVRHSVKAGRYELQRDTSHIIRRFYEFSLVSLFIHCLPPV